MQQKYLFLIKHCQDKTTLIKLRIERSFLNLWKKGIYTKTGLVLRNWGKCSLLFRVIYSACGEGDSTPLQYSCLENPMDGGAWWAAVHRVAKSRTWLKDFPFTSRFHALEKEMASRSSVLTWRIPGMGEPGGLPSMGSHRVGHDWSDLAAAFSMYWRS